MRDYRVTYKRVLLMCDSSSAIRLAKNPVFYGRVKHIKVRHHFLRDHIEKGDIEMKYIETERRLVDILTKPLRCDSFCLFAGGTWCLPSILLGLKRSLCFTLYILYLIFIALHFIHIYLIYHCFTYYTSLYLVDYACQCARVSRDEMWNSFMLELAR
jgi:hypothetical protein